MAILLHLLCAVLAHTPLALLRLFGRALGDLNWILNTRSARTTVANIEYCYSDLTPNQRTKLVRDSLRHTGCTLFETAMVWKSTPRRMESLLHKVHGLENLIEPLQSSGVICVLPHIGCWEFAGYYLPALAEVTSLFDARRLGSLEQSIQKFRSKYGMTMVPVSVTGLRLLLKNTQSGKIVNLFPDQVPTRGQHVVAPFMGHDAHTTTLVAKLIRRNNVRVVTLSILRVPNGFDIYVDPCSEDIYASDLVQSAASMNRSIEASVRRDPAQYQWEYKRFRRISNIYQ